MERQRRYTWGEAANICRSPPFSCLQGAIWRTHEAKSGTWPLAGRRSTSGAGGLGCTLLSLRPGILLLSHCKGINACVWGFLSHLSTSSVSASYSWARGLSLA